MERTGQILGHILKFMVFYDFSLPLIPNGQKQQQKKEINWFAISSHPKNQGGVQKWTENEAKNTKS